MIVDRLNAAAVDRLAWHPVVQADAKRRVAERLNSLEHLVVKILTPIERAQARGVSEDNLGEIVSRWAGPASRWVSLGRITKRGPVRILQLQLANPAVAMTLRPRLAELVQALASTGIAEVRL